MPTPHVDREAIDFREFDTPAVRFGPSHVIRDVPSANPEVLNKPERVLPQASTEQLGHLAQAASGVYRPVSRLETFEI